MKLKRIASLCAVVVFGASTAIYAGNTSETDKVEEKNVMESFERENQDSMAENEQLPETALSLQEVKLEETETIKEEVTENSTEQQKNTETTSAAGTTNIAGITNAAGTAENTVNMPQETEAEVFDPSSLIPPGNEEEWERKFQKYTLFYYAYGSVKQIVTKVNADGTFCAEDLGIWLKKQDVYDISVLEEDGNYKKLLYKSRPENQQREEFEPSDDTDILYFDMLVVPGEDIIFQGGYIETVDEVYSDGSFTTEYTSE